MPKIFSRRFPLSRGIFSLSIVFLLVLLAVIHIHQESIYSYVRHRTLPCSGRKRNLSLTSYSVPPRHLLMPYEEFISRTTIVCQSVRLDQTNKSLVKFHPQYSPYLRGVFPFVIPRPHITFDDIEHFYTGSSILNNTWQTPFASNITFEQIPYRFSDGMWRPIEVESIQRTAILIPFQDKRST